MKLLVPCCGRSSRFPNLPPKWMLPDHDGLPMIRRALEGLRYAADDLIVAILREHEDRFDATAGLAAAFGRSVRTCILERPTRSQAETVAETLRMLDLDEPFLVKDSDGSFLLDDLAASENYVCVDSLNNHDAVNARNKSYVRTNENGRIVDIREKSVISDTFNVGGYYFTSPGEFLERYERLSSTNVASPRELYLSDVIGAMLADGRLFRARFVGAYHDWGTLREWRRRLLDRRAYFVALDGFVFERGGEFFRPRFSEVKAHPAAVELLIRLASRGCRITYLSIRPASAAELTQRQLRAAGAPEGTIVYGCAVGPWTVVASPVPVLPDCAVETFELLADGDMDELRRRRLLGE